MRPAHVRHWNRPWPRPLSRRAIARIASIASSPPPLPASVPLAFGRGWSLPVRSVRPRRAAGLRLCRGAPSVLLSALSLALSLSRSLYLCRAFPAQPRCCGSAAATDAPPLPLPCAVAKPSLSRHSAVAPRLLRCRSATNANTPPRLCRSASPLPPHQIRHHTMS